MTEKELPEWTTEMDKEILKLLNTEMTLTPTVVAENIDRSRGAVARRLNTLEAGGLVIKVDRGKYRITTEAMDMVEGGLTLVEISEEERSEAVEKDQEIEMQIQEDLGITRKEYLTAVSQEYDRLRDEELNSSNDELLSRAFNIVEEKYREQ